MLKIRTMEVRIFFSPVEVVAVDSAGFDREDVKSSPLNYFGDPNAASAKPQEGQTPTFWKRPISSLVATTMHDVVLEKNIATLQAELQSRKWRKLNRESSLWVRPRRLILMH